MKNTDKTIESLKVKRLSKIFDENEVSSIIVGLSGNKNYDALVIRLSAINGAGIILKNIKITEDRKGLEKYHEEAKKADRYVLQVLEAYDDKRYVTLEESARKLYDSIAVIRVYESSGISPDNTELLFEKKSNIKIWFSVNLRDMVGSKLAEIPVKIYITAAFFFVASMGYGTWSYFSDGKEGIKKPNLVPKPISDKTEREPKENIKSDSNELSNSNYEKDKMEKERIQSLRIGEWKGNIGYIGDEYKGQKMANLQEYDPGSDICSINLGIRWISENKWDQLNGKWLIIKYNNIAIAQIATTFNDPQGRDYREIKKRSLHVLLSKKLKRELMGENIGTIENVCIYLCNSTNKNDCIKLVEILKREKKKCNNNLLSIRIK